MSTYNAWDEFVPLAEDSSPHWQLAMESAGQGFWDINVDTGKRFCSPMWYKMRGIDRSDQTCKSFEAWLGRMHPDDVERISSLVNDVEAGLTDRIDYEYRERHADGHYVWILCKGRVISRKPDGSLVHCVGTDTDISAIKSVMSGLHVLAHRHQLAMGASNLGVWEFDIASQAAIWDDNLKRLFQVTDEDMKDRNFWFSIVHPDDLAPLEAASLVAVKSRSSFMADYRIIPKDGIVRHVRTRAAYYKGEDSGAKLVGVAWDVTAEIDTAAELRNARDLAEKQNAELKQAWARIERDALHDALTGLPNRRQLEAKLLALQKGTVVASHWRVALFHIDLDRFKQINDTFGHSAGDAVLKNAAQIFRNSFPGDSLICRAGGDEFVVIVEGHYTDDELSVLADTTITAIALPFEHKNQTYQIGASIGVATATFGTQTGKQLFLNADLALYRAKSEGRNRVCFFTSDMQARAQADRFFAADIARGIERGEFIPFYQPQFDARSRDCTGVEALVRWQHPQKGLLSPADFLDRADELNLLAQIDDLMMHQALADLARWHAQGIMVPRVSVNVSARRLGDPALLDRLSAVAFPEGKIAFELLESIYLEDDDDVIAANLAGLRKLGIAIELDDFGTGHASIAGLTRLRPQRFKIDRSLIAPIVVSVEQRRLVRSMIDIGKALNIQVVAEGVETLEHADVLEKLDCDILQGHYFSKPLSAKALTAFLKKKVLCSAA